MVKVPGVAGWFEALKPPGASSPPLSTVVAPTIVPVPPSTPPLATVTGSVTTSVGWSASDPVTSEK